MRTLFTIGTQDIDGTGDARDTVFIDVLKQHDIDAIIDVRLNPEPRWAKFASGKHIQSILTLADIQYFRCAEFAPTRQMLQEWRKNEDWPAYESEYLRLWHDRDMLSYWGRHFNHLEKPCLLCAEKKGQHCHRNLLAGYLRENLLDRDICFLP